jgi:hypothetical protein
MNEYRREMQIREHLSPHRIIAMLHIQYTHAMQMVINKPAMMGKSMNENPIAQLFN